MLVVFATKNIELQTLDEQQGSALRVGGTIEYCSGKTYDLVQISLSEKQYFMLKLIRVLFPVLTTGPPHSVIPRNEMISVVTRARACGSDVSYLIRIFIKFQQKPLQ